MPRYRIIWSVAAGTDTGEKTWTLPATEGEA